MKVYEIIITVFTLGGGYIAGEYDPGLWMVGTRKNPSCKFHRDGSEFYLKRVQWSYAWPFYEDFVLDHSINVGPGHNMGHSS